MALNIRNSETEQLAASLAKETGESKTEAVTQALKDRLATGETAEGSPSSSR